MLGEKATTGADEVETGEGKLAGADSRRDRDSL